MSAPADPLFRQRLLRAGGLYLAALDGIWGPKSIAADEAFRAATDELRRSTGALDERTEANIATLLLPVQRLARQHMGNITQAQASSAKPREYTVRIISGTRTYAEQAALYAQGRTKPGPKVTNAKAGYSNHNLGLAYDVGLFAGTKYLTGATVQERASYAEVATLAPAPLEWGGDWSNPDLPHYQHATGLTQSELRSRFERGELYLPN